MLLDLDSNCTRITPNQERRLVVLSMRDIIKSVTITLIRPTDYVTSIYSNRSLAGNPALTFYPKMDYITWHETKWLKLCGIFIEQKDLST